MTYRGSLRAISLLAATIALALLAGCYAGRRDAAAKRDTAKHTDTANVISPHLPFGNPSEAGGAANNQLVLRQQFAASWNAGKRIANWVAWRLVASDIGDTERSQFYADHDIDTPTPKDYTNSGYDRGHLCPSKDRSDNPENNKAVFTMLNIIPQAGDNNRGPWEKAEEFERSLAKAGREVYIIASGPDQRAKSKGSPFLSPHGRSSSPSKAAKAGLTGSSKRRSSLSSCRIMKESRMIAGSSSRLMCPRSRRRPAIISSLTLR